MNPGPVEEAGKVANSAVSALASTPALLVLVLLQLGIFGMVAWSVSTTRAELHVQMRTLIERCVPAETK